MHRCGAVEDLQCYPTGRRSDHLVDATVRQLRPRASLYGVPSMSGIADLLQFRRRYPIRRPVAGPDLRERSPGRGELVHAQVQRTVGCPGTSTITAEHLQGPTRAGGDVGGFDPQISQRTQAISLTFQSPKSTGELVELVELLQLCPVPVSFETQLNPNLFERDQGPVDRVDRSSRPQISTPADAVCRRRATSAPELQSAGERSAHRLGGGQRLGLAGDRIRSSTNRA